MVKNKAKTILYTERVKLKILFVQEEKTNIMKLKTDKKKKHHHHNVMQLTHNFMFMFLMSQDD